MLNYQQTVISQNGASPTINQLIANMNTWVDPGANIDQFYNLLWNVDTAVGYGLDVWGRIVGVGRVLNIATINYFGMQGPSSASGLPFGQAVFYNGGATTNNYVLADAPYRVVILAKALFNISDGTIRSINQILINLFGPKGLLPVTGNSYCTDGLNMTMTYTFNTMGVPLTPIQVAIIYQSGVLPRPCGVLATVVQL